MNRRLSVAAVALACVATTADAQTQITRPIRIIVPYVPGGGTDTLTRLIGPYISEEFGQQVVIDNRPGGSSTIGTQLVAKAHADGEVIGMIDAAFVINPSLLGTLPYDTIKDFAPISLIAVSPLVLCVHPQLPVKSVKDLIALAKSKPGKIHFGSAGNGTAVHLAGEQFRSVTGTDIVHVPYKGAGQAITDLIGGQIEMAFSTQSSVKQYVSAGRLRALAITTPKRTTVMPEVMTFTEAGYPGVEAKTINGLVGPAGTPKDYIARVHRVVQKALRQPEFQAKLGELGFEPVGNSPEEFAKYIRTEIDKWGRVVKTSGAKAAM
ncbi:MAG: tripartite tricarboxylate transporter substrate binding protein [Rhodospirillaceae bacterium]